MKPTLKFEKISNAKHASSQDELATDKTESQLSTPQESREVILNKIHHLLEQAYKATETFHSNH